MDVHYATDVDVDVGLRSLDEIDLCGHKKNARKLVAI